MGNEEYYTPWALKRSFSETVSDVLIRRRFAGGGAAFELERAVSRCEVRRYPEGEIGC